MSENSKKLMRGNVVHERRTSMVADTSTDFFSDDLLEKCWPSIIRSISDSPSLVALRNASPHFHRQNLKDAMDCTLISALWEMVLPIIIRVIPPLNILPMRSCRKSFRTLIDRELKTMKSSAVAEKFILDSPDKLHRFCIVAPYLIEGPLCRQFLTLRPLDDICLQSIMDFLAVNGKPIKLMRLMIRLDVPKMVFERLSRLLAAVPQLLELHIEFQEGKWGDYLDLRYMEWETYVLEWLPPLLSLTKLKLYFNDKPAFTENIVPLLLAKYGKNIQQLKINARAFLSLSITQCNTFLPGIKNLTLTNITQGNSLGTFEKLSKVCWPTIHCLKLSGLVYDLNGQFIRALINFNSSLEALDTSNFEMDWTNFTSTDIKEQEFKIFERLRQLHFSSARDFHSKEIWNIYEVIFKNLTALYFSWPWGSRVGLRSTPIVPMWAEHYFIQFQQLEKVIETGPMLGVPETWIFLRTK